MATAEEIQALLAVGKRYRRLLNGEAPWLVYGHEKDAKPDPGPDLQARDLWLLEQAGRSGDIVLQNIAWFWQTGRQSAGEQERNLFTHCMLADGCCHCHADGVLAGALTCQDVQQRRKATAVLRIPKQPRTLRVRRRIE